MSLINSIDVEESMIWSDKYMLFNERTDCYNHIISSFFLFYLKHMEKRIFIDSVCIMLSLSDRDIHSERNVLLFFFFPSEMGNWESHQIIILPCGKPVEGARMPRNLTHPNMLLTETHG